MASKIKVDTIENVAGSGNVSLGSGHNFVVPGTLNITGASTLAGGIANAGTVAAGTIGSSVVFPAGVVIQVVNGPGNGARLSSTSTSYTNTPVTATITPKFATSKILVRWSTIGLSANDVYLYFRLMCAIGGGSQALVNTNEDHTTLGGYDEANWSGYSHEALHSPNTTSACVYTVQSKAGSGTHIVGWSGDTDNKNMMNITLMEIAG